MSRFSLNFTNGRQIHPELNKKTSITNDNMSSSNIFNKKRVFYVCSSGGCGSTILINYLQNFGKV